MACPGLSTSGATLAGFAPVKAVAGLSGDRDGEPVSALLPGLPVSRAALLVPGNRFGEPVRSLLDTVKFAPYRPRMTLSIRCFTSSQGSSVDVPDWWAETRPEALAGTLQIDHNVATAGRDAIPGLPRDDRGSDDQALESPVVEVSLEDVAAAMESL